MNYVVGTIGQPPRLVMSASEDDAVRQQRDGEVVFLSDAPIGRWIIADDGVSLLPIATPLDEQKRVRWLDARAYRDGQASGGCMTPYGRIDSDPESRGKINGGSTAAIAAQAGGMPFSVDWTMEDNSIVTLDAGAMLMVGLAVMAHVDQCQRIGTTIRNRIAAASDQDALDAIDIQAGYP